MRQGPPLLLIAAICFAVTTPLILLSIPTWLALVLAAPASLLVLIGAGALADWLEHRRWKRRYIPRDR